MTSDPYAHKPNQLSEPNEWHELGFQLSIDRAVDWEKFDLRKWAHVIAKYTALVMAKTLIDTEELEDPETIKTLIMGIHVDRIKFVTDDNLHDLIDKFEE